MKEDFIKWYQKERTFHLVTIEIQKVTPNKSVTTAVEPCYDVSVYKVKAEVEENWGLVFGAGAECGRTGDRVLLCLCVWVSLKSAKQLQWRRLILLL